MMKKGFTLIELLIVISILVLLLGMGLASFNTFNRRERLKQAGLTLKSTLRFAQTKSISVDKPSSGCTEFVGMRVAFTETTYTVQHFCTPEGLVGTADSVSIATSGLTFSPIPSSFTFETHNSSADLTTDLNLDLTNGTQIYRLIVSPNGNVSDIGFQ